MRTTPKSRALSLALGLLTCAALPALALMATPTDAEAFCGTYVAPADGPLYNDATRVVLMREGTRTILSMQNNYRGPAKDFAMVIPVPQVLQQYNVKTLPRELFERVDQLTAPRLVEYFERDPCDTPQSFKCYQYSCDSESHTTGTNNVTGTNNTGGMGNTSGTNNTTPKVEAEFTVGEYEIVVLSAEDSTGLGVWLKENGYKMPGGAEEVFASYIQQGMYFFVARINPAKVTFKDGEAVLSPLRFSYTSQDFSLPIRLGLLNSSGQQDLIINIIARDRYNAANYPNTVIPTNLEITPRTREHFTQFYDRLFAKTLEVNPPGTIVTEYAWQPDPWTGAKCDPCPPNPPDDRGISTLGADVLATNEGIIDPSVLRIPWTVTRLHMRYQSDTISDDIIFKKAQPIVGGTPNQLNSSAAYSNFNQFQGRYIIHNHWPGEIKCQYPYYGRWVGTKQAEQEPSTQQLGPEITDTTPLSDHLYTSSVQLGVDAHAELPDRTPMTRFPPRPQNCPTREESCPTPTDWGGRPLGSGDDGGACSVVTPGGAAGASFGVFVMAALLGGWRRRRLDEVQEP